jgi:hypothetical protein
MGTNAAAAEAAADAVADAVAAALAVTAGEDSRWRARECRSQPGR